GLVLALAVTAGATVFLRVTKLGTAMRSLANDREITAMLGVPVRRVEAAAWLGSGLLAGATGLLLSTLVGLDAVTLTFLVIASLSAALVGRLQSLWVTVVAGLVIGIIQSSATPFDSVSPYRSMTPFLVAIIALLWFARRRPLVVR
ncbi:MAG: branched-chain amino acid ABC transporter permease, partial [Candidatus Dormibacteraeota bacterium]|nr:branched-chain amino acid ABC transporter permease [Candidatus Dormibacteraeota bacterium]